MAVLVVMVVLTLLKFSPGLPKEFFCFAVVGGRLTLLGERLRIWDKVEVAEALLALTNELDRHHQYNLVAVCLVLSVDEWVMMWEVNLVVEQVS